MKKFLFLALMALVACAGIASAQANLGENYSGQRAISFTRSAPTTTPWYSATWQDTVTIASSADSVRTSNINTDGWDWSSTIMNGTAQRAVATVLLWVPPGSTATCAGDTIYYAIEPSFDGGATYAINGSSMPAAVGAAVSIGNYAVIGNALGSYAGTGGVYYRGFITLDLDTGMAAAGNQAYMVQGFRDFRLKLFGDAAQIGALRGAVYPITSKFVR